MRSQLQALIKHPLLQPVLHWCRTGCIVLKTSVWLQKNECALSAL